MSSTPRALTATNTRRHPPEIQQLLDEKSENFVGRQFVFTAIADFLHRYDSGYFTLRGAPGSGKSAILAKYTIENPHVVYYNAQIEGKNQTDQFLTNICTQLINYYPLGLSTGEQSFAPMPLPDNVTEGSWFFGLLLQKISDQLEPHQQLIIAIDALDAIDHNSQPLGSNLFYLPRYLPERVYFLLTRRPFLKEKSGLLIETPSQSLDLEKFPEQNREDVQAYIQQCLPPLLQKAGLGERLNLKSWLSTYHVSEQEFSQQLIAQSQNNFMYLSQLLSAIAEGFYPEPFQFEQLPPDLEAYYQQHWQKMRGNDLSAVELAVLHSLITSREGISAQMIAQIINEDEYEVEEVLENWIEFLQQQRIDKEIFYSFYHSSFRDWLELQLNLET